MLGDESQIRGKCIFILLFKKSIDDFEGCSEGRLLERRTRQLLVNVILNAVADW